MGIGLWNSWDKDFVRESRDMFQDTIRYIQLKAQEEIRKAMPANRVTSEPVQPRHSIGNYGNAHLSFKILLI
jgi:hypothetical protein